MSIKVWRNGSMVRVFPTPTPRKRTTLPSSPVQFSEDYKWDEKKVLGRGASAVVYKGRRLSDGEPVAVKTYTLPESYLREVKYLKTLKHRNIVKVLSVDETNLTTPTSNHIVVLEFCQSSLYARLIQPEWTYGLETTDFLLLIDHLSSALNYLAQNNIMHRDIKSGNILRQEKETEVSYKLTDFDTARTFGTDDGSSNKWELENSNFQNGLAEASFYSMQGTEEYLHPDVFKKAFQISYSGCSFNVTVDMWSLGCTLYHAACGRLPFKTPNGRQDKLLMSELTSQKPKHAISGTIGSDRKAVYSTRLPNDILLSNSYKRQVEPILRILLNNQASPSDYWTYFDTASALTSSVKIDLFRMRTGEKVTLFARPDDTLAQLKDWCKEIIDPFSHPFKLLWGSRSLTDRFTDACTMNSLVKVYRCSPIILIENDMNEAEESECHFSSEPPETLVARLIDGDMLMSKHLCLSDDIALMTGIIRGLVRVGQLMTDAEEKQTMLLEGEATVRDYVSRAFDRTLERKLDIMPLTGHVENVLETTQILRKFHYDNNPNDPYYKRLLTAEKVVDESLKANNYDMDGLEKEVTESFKKLEMESYSKSFTCKTSIFSAKVEAVVREATEALASFRTHELVKVGEEDHNAHTRKLVSEGFRARLFDWNFNYVSCMKNTETIHADVSNHTKAWFALLARLSLMEQSLVTLQTLANNNAIPMLRVAETAYRTKMNRNISKSASTSPYFYFRLKPDSGEIECTQKSMYRDDDDDGGKEDDSFVVLQ